ncbi:hypothetical protein J1N35_040534 [Gossypium stocksii]|uniref:Uncharacterized protein n=1 Tax=Gossypium stocksii TaxID=47602 RepID=A0A9D3UE06_9ROSI|nr:hypothetical protein J1N35_040534 [Gossypium stocksii]
MDASLVCFDHNYIFATQLAMANDHLLEAFIHNTGEPLILEIRGYLQEAGFLHVSRMQGDFKLNPTLISTLVEIYTFHLLCDKCTITLEDVALKLGLSMDEPVITRSVVVRGKVDLCMVMLGNVSNKFEGGRILINCLEKVIDKLPYDAMEELIQ